MSFTSVKDIEMEILLDGVSKSIDTKDSINLEELLRLLERDFIDKSRVITRIVVNEELLDEGQEVGLGAFPLSEIASLALETADTAGLACEALQDAQEYLPTLSAILEQSAARIREGNVREGLKETSEALEVIGAFGEVLEGIRGAFRIDFGKVKIEEFSLLDKLNELGRLAKAILAAAKEENWTLLADLLEYELSPLLYEWMAVIPDLVSLLPGPSGSASGG
jgi:hypothetical protein